MAISEQAKLAIALEAKNNANAAFGQLNSQINGLVSAAKRAAIALAAAFAFREVISATEQWGQELHLLMTTLGVSGEQASKLNYIMKTVGIDTETGAQAFAILGKRIDTSMKEIKQGTSVFDHFGIKVLDAHGNVKNFTTLLGDMNEVFQKMPDGLQKDAAMMELMSRGGKQMHDLMSLTKDEIAALSKEVEDLGLMMSTQTAEKMEQFNRLTRRTGMAFDALKVQIGNALLPVLNELMLGFIRFVKDVGPRIADIARVVFQGFMQLWNAVSLLVQAFGRVLNAILSVTTGGQRLSGVMKVLGEGFRIALGIIKQLAEWLNVLANDIGEKGLVKAITDFFSKIGEQLDALGPAGTIAKDALIAIGGALVLNALAGVVTGIAGIVTAITKIPGVKPLPAVLIWVDVALVVGAIDQVDKTIKLLTDNPYKVKIANDTGQLDVVKNELLFWLGALVAGVALGLGAIPVAIGVVIGTAIALIITNFESLKTIIGNVFSAIGTFVSTKIDEFNHAFDVFGTDVRRAFDELGTNVRGVFDDVGKKIHDTFEAALTALPNMIKTKFDEIKENFRQAINALIAIANLIPNVHIEPIAGDQPPSGSGGGGGFGGDAEAIAAARCEAKPWDGPEGSSGYYQWNWKDHTCFPVYGKNPRGKPMAEGGVVMARPGGTQVTVGEGGQDEAIVPLARGRGTAGIGGGVTINVDVHDNVAESESELADMVADRIVKNAQLRRQFSF